MINAILWIIIGVVVLAFAGMIAFIYFLGRYEKCNSCRQRFKEGDGLSLGFAGFICCNCLKSLSERVVEPIKGFFGGK